MSSHATDIFLIVNEQALFQSLSERLEANGYTIVDNDGAKFFKNKKMWLKRVHREDTSINENSTYNIIVNLLAPESSSITIALKDMSRIKVYQASTRCPLDNHLTLSEIERHHIIVTLKQCDWQCKTTAKLLGIDRSTLYRKMKKYGISKDNQY